MSTHNLNKGITCWENCPVDVLLVICRKLDLKSLINALFINKHWQDVVEYYCQHFSMWDRMVEKEMKVFKEKSTLNYRDIVFQAQLWYNVKTATVRLHSQLSFDSIRSVCVYKDNLIVVSNKAMKYYKIENSRLAKVLTHTLCISCDETSSIRVDLRLSCDNLRSNTILSLVNKLHKKGCDCNQDVEYLYEDISLYKVHFNCCYTVDTKNVLRVNRADTCHWETKLLARYYGSDPICGLHVHEQDVYVLLKRGDILRVDLACRKLDKLLQLDLPQLYQKAFMFHTCSVLCAVLPKKEFEIRAQKQKDCEVIVAACPGLACVKEHGHVLLMGYEDGKIEIFLTDKLLQNKMTPELSFYLQSYMNIMPNKIYGLDIYERNSVHHLFVTTRYTIYEFLICHM